MAGGGGAKVCGTSVFAHMESFGRLGPGDPGDSLRSLDMVSLGLQALERSQPTMQGLKGCGARAARPPWIPMGHLGIPLGPIGVPMGPSRAP